MFQGAHAMTDVGLQFSPNNKLIDRDLATTVHQKIEGGHGPHQGEFEAHLVPKKSTSPPAFIVGHDEENDDRAGGEASE